MARRKHARERTSYYCMKARCLNQSHENFAHYGGRGVTICERWLHGEGGMSGFLCFFEDMGERPACHTLDRIDSTGNYEPANCRWASPKLQAENRRPRRSSRIPVAVPSHRLRGTPPKTGGKCRYRGVTSRVYGGSVRWRGTIKVGGKVFTAGTFRTALQAALAVDRLAHEVRRSEWRFNFPEVVRSQSK